MIAVGNGEKCPYCDIVLDSRPDYEGEDITAHLLDKHPEEVLKDLF